MKTKSFLSLAILAVLVFRAICLPEKSRAASQTYDLNADWSNTSNPNGVWSYRAGSTLTHAQTGSPHTAGDQPVWMGPDNYLPIWFKHLGAPFGDLQTGDVCVHSANADAEGIANILWTAPAAGTIDVSGGAWIAADQGRSSVWSLWLNGNQLTSGEVASGDPYDRNSPFQFSAGSGGGSVLQDLAVSAGDQLMLQIRKESGTYGTFVGVNWSVALTELTCAALAPNAVAWWRGEANPADSIGTSHGTLRNGATFAPGKVGQAFSFDGIDDRLEVANAANLNPTTAVTLDAWVNPRSFTKSYGAVVAKSAGQRSYGMWITADGRVHVEPSSLGTSYAFTGPGVVPLNTWTHVAAVITAGVGFKIYVNGVEQTVTVSGTPTLSATIAPVTIGNSDPGSYDWLFSGLIDEVDVFDRALAGSEIQAIHAAGAAGKCVEVCTAPSITMAPPSQNVCPGTTATFTTSASGTAPLNYQWSKDGVDIPGATAASLTINSTGAGNAGSYRVRVSNACGQVESSPASLTVVDAAPVISLNGPATVLVEACVGSYVEPGATASDDCDGPLPVQVSADPINATQPGTYHVYYFATDSAGHTASATRTVIVQDTTPPTFTIAPANLSLACGPGNAAAITTWLASAVATDTCGAVTIAQSTAWSGPCGTGTALVIWTATDSHGLTASTTATLTIQPDRMLTGVVFETPSLQVTLPANTTQTAAVTVRNNGSCATLIQSAQIAASFTSPGLSVLTALPVTVCAGGTTTLALQINTSGALEGVYPATLTIAGADGGSQSLPLEIVVNGRLLPDLTLSYTGGGVSVHPANSPVFPVTGEAFTVSAALKNIGTAPAGAFTVKFFEGANLLGTAQIASLASGQSTTATLNIPAGFPQDGFYLIRAEVVPPEGGELRLANNSASTLLQVGQPFTGVAFIRLTSSFTPDCSGFSGSLQVHAEYVIVTDQATLTFPVQGGRLDAQIVGTRFSVNGAHTDRDGNYSTSLGLPAAGTYTMEVMVTDFTLTETDTFPITISGTSSCPIGGVPEATGSSSSVTPHGESADLYLCSSDISFRTSDGSTTISAPPATGQGVQICAVVSYYTSEGRALYAQPVHFKATRQTASGAEEYFLGTGLANFAGGGTTTVCLPEPWTPPGDGVYVIEVSLAPLILQPEVNDVATRTLVVGNPAPPVTVIQVDVEGGGCSPPGAWISGRATYEREGSPALPVVCGQITVRFYDSANTLLGTFVAPATTDHAGYFYFHPGYHLPPGVNRIVVDVTDGTLTGSDEFTIECVASENAPAPEAPPAPAGDLYVFSEHIGFLASDCLSGWNRNPLPGETISIAADIHYFDNYLGTPLLAVPVDVNVLIPVGNTLQPFNVTHTTVDFAFGGGSSVICVPWTPAVLGPQIVQVVIDPEPLPVLPSEYFGNNAATRMIFVGLQDVVLTADPSERRVRPGQSASYALHGEALNNAHPTLNLAAYFDGENPPAGLTTALADSVITLPDDTTLTLATTTATPPGTYRFYVVGSGDQRSAIVRVKLIVEPPDTEAPALTLLGDNPMTVECHTTFTDPGATATDAIDGNLTASISISGAVDANTPGTYSLTYSVSDAAGNTASASRTVSVRDTTPPTIFCPSPIVITAPAGSCGAVVNFPVTANDACGAVTVVCVPPAGSVFPKGTTLVNCTATDASGNASGCSFAVTVNAAPVANAQSVSTEEDTSVGITLSGSQCPGDATTSTIVSGPAHGALSGTVPNLNYTPAANYHGADEFTFEINDGRGGTAQAVVSITVTPVNDAPAPQDDTATTDEDTSVNIAVLANDMDPDGDTLSVSAVTQGAHGTVTANDDGTINYTPAADFNGSDSFTYTVSDGNNGTATATVIVTVNPVNDPPVAVQDNGSTPEDTFVTVAVLPNDHDVDGDTLSVTAVSAATGGAVVNPDGTITFTPAANFNGSANFTYTLTDGHGAEASGNVVIAVVPVNDPPVAQPGTATAPEDTIVEITMSATDPDGDALTFTIVTPPLHGWLGTVDGNHVAYMPEPNYYGPDSFRYRASDGSASSEADIAITVLPFNDPPILGPVSDQTVLEGQALALTLTATDWEGDTLTFSATGLPAGATLDPATGAFAWTPNFTQAGVYPVTFAVSDPSGAYDEATITITVVDVPVTTNQDPDCSQARPSIGEIWPPNHKPVAIDILGVTDPDGDPVTVTITKILQDEPTNTAGDGNTWVDGGGIGTSQAWVRAERVGTPRCPGNGRVYEIFFTVADGRGGKCHGSVLVGVPHDQGHGPAIDDGVRYDSTQASGPRVKCKQGGTHKCTSHCFGRTSRGNGYDGGSHHDDDDYDDGCGHSSHQ